MDVTNGTIHVRWKLIIFIPELKHCRKQRKYRDPKRRDISAGRNRELLSSHTAACSFQIRDMSEKSPLSLLSVKVLVDGLLWVTIREATGHHCPGQYRGIVRTTEYVIDCHNGIVFHTGKISGTCNVIPALY